LLAIRLFVQSASAAMATNCGQYVSKTDMPGAARAREVAAKAMHHNELLQMEQSAPRVLLPTINLFVGAA